MRALLLFLGLALSLQAHSQVVGRVLLVGGDAFAVRNGQQVRLAYSSPVEFKDILRTGPASSLQVRFVDEGLLSLRENTEFEIEDYRFGQQQQEGEHAFFRLLKGGFRSVTGLIGRSRNADYRVRTPTATIGIRGTDYAVRECADDCFETPQQRSEADSDASRGQGAPGQKMPNGLYGSVLGLSNGTNQVTLQNNATPQPVTFGINQHFYVANANTAPQQLLQPPTFVAAKPQGKTQSAQGQQGSGGEQASTGSGASGDSRPQTVTDATVVPAPVAVPTPPVLISSTTLPNDTGVLGFWISSSMPTNPNGGGALINQSALSLTSGGVPTGFTVPAGCTGPNNSGNCNGVSVSGLAAPVQSGTGNPDGSSQVIFWGRWNSGTVIDGGQVITLSNSNQAHLMYGPLTPADVIAAKTGSLTLFSGVLGTTPTNNLGEVAVSTSLGSLTVNFTARTAVMAAGSVSFASQNWTLPAASGNIVIQNGGAFFLAQGSGGSCGGTGCSGSAQVRAAGIFLGPVGDHVGASVSGASTSGAQFGAVRVFCPSGC
ncbi:MAG: FecR domain-containing protein [Betaproteobacteria bacterium]|nr:FecR domain-containing protein [Betaproteobacteria bacterium]